MCMVILCLGVDADVTMSKDKDLLEELGGPLEIVILSFHFYIHLLFLYSLANSQKENPILPKKLSLVITGSNLKDPKSTIVQWDSHQVPLLNIHEFWKHDWM